MTAPALCSVHTHSVHCDGKATLEAMAEAAYRAGVKYFGASGHSHTPFPWDAVDSVLPADTSAYQAEVLRLREVYAGRMEVLLGIEQDSGSLQPVPDWAEYWIGSVHNLQDPATGTCGCIDWDPETFQKTCRDLAGGDAMALVEHYYKDVAATAAQKPTILGHVDLIVKFNEGGRFFDENAPRYRAAALNALHAADPTQTLLEINTGAVFRGYRKAPYPAPFLLQEWRAMGGRVILTSDAHSTDAIIWGYAQSAELARAAGFRECSILTREGERTCPL